MKITPFLFAAVLMSGCPLNAQDGLPAAVARIDLNAERDEIRLAVGATSSGARAANSAWREAKAPFWITAQFPGSASEWKDGSIVFTPDKSGMVVVQLKGPLVRENAASPAMPGWVEFDDFRVAGATLANPDFEKHDGERPAEWYRPPPPANSGSSAPARIVAAASASGQAHVRVWHNGALHQSIQVVKNQPVSFAFKYRLVR